jgi:hypothetical protein
MSDSFAKLPQPPYYAVVFSAQRTAGDDGYGDTANAMGELASRQPGYFRSGVSPQRRSVWDDGFVLVGRIEHSRLEA